MSEVRGALHKMHSELGEQVEYSLALSDKLIVNQLLGKRVRLQFEGAINCIHCDRKTNKSFSQGYCYPCFTKLPQCDTCIMSPEKCHFSLGTCRDEDWGIDNCFTDHYVYLSNTSSLKVGITRHSQLPTRWIDQGAVSALPIYRVTNRRLSGLVETLFKSQVKDKTNWRAMLKNELVDIDLEEERSRLHSIMAQELASLTRHEGIQALQPLTTSPVEINFPVLEYPVKVTSFNFDKTPRVEGVLLGVKGQYLIFDTGVINIRKFTGYDVSISWAD